MAPGGRRRVQMTALGGAALLVVAALTVVVLPLREDPLAAGSARWTELAAVAAARPGARNAAGLNTAGAMVQRLRAVCPCAVSGTTLLGPQALSDCPCADAIAAAVAKALNGNMYAPPPPPPTQQAPNPAYPPGTVQPAPPPPVTTPPGEPDINYMAIIDTLTRDVVADSNLISGEMRA